MSSPLTEHVNTLGQDPKRRHGARAHKLVINGIAAELVRRGTCQGRALGATQRMEVKESWSSSARPVTSRL